MTYIPWSSDFALCLKDYLMYEHYYLGLWVSMTQSLTSKYRSLWPIFHGPVILHYILKTICCMNIILWDYGSVWRDVWFQNKCTGRGSSIGSEFAWHTSGPEFDPHVRHILSWRLGHENISTAILPLPLIQEEQLSVTGERMCTKYW